MKTRGILCAGKRNPGRAGFTLVELLVVVAIIGVLSSLMAPAVRGLIGVGGRRGGMNTLVSTIEKARLSAIETGATNTRVGFPFGVPDGNAAFSSVIVFRDPLPEYGETNQLVPLSRWLRMPSGIFIASDNLTDMSVGAGLLPKLATSNGVVDVTDLKVLTFDRFGKLKQADKPVEIRVGEKADPKGSFLKSSENCFLLRVRPLTGRVTVEDRSTNSTP